MQVAQDANSVAQPVKCRCNSAERAEEQRRKLSDDSAEVTTDLGDAMSGDGDIKADQEQEPETADFIPSSEVHDVSGAE